MPVTDPAKNLSMLQKMRELMGPGISGYVSGGTDINYYVSESEEFHTENSGWGDEFYNGRDQPVAVRIRDELTEAIVEQFGGDYVQGEDGQLMAAEGLIPAGQINSRLQQLEDDLGQLAGG